jgi:hypothetical protein
MICAGPIEAQGTLYLVPLVGTVLDIVALDGWAHASVLTIVANIIGFEKRTTALFVVSC